MADLITMLSAVAGQQGEEADEDFNQTVLLLHGDGTNGAQNNTFLDSSTNNFTITRNGNTTQGTFSPFSGPNGYWSNFLDGNDWIQVADNAALELGSGDFTIEAWVYFTTANLGGSGTGISLVSKWNASNYSYLAGFYNDGGTWKLNFAYSTNGSSTTNIRVTGGLAANVWYHVAYVRSGSSLKMFLDGVEKTTTETISGTLFDGNEPVAIGRTGDGFNYVTGYMSNVRIVKGTAVYTSNFTPPTAPLTAISGTSLLTCQSNRFVDNSTNAFAITRNGDVRVTPFSPFATTAAYSAGTNGGSGYFDGTGDSLQIAHNVDFEFGSGAFTIEFWAYISSLSGNYTGIVGVWVAGGTVVQNSWYIAINAFDTTNKLGFSYSDGVNGTNLNFGSANTTGSWNHYAIVRSGNLLYAFKDGVLLNSGGTAITATLTNGTVDLYVGTIGTAGGGTAFNGYISGLRVQKGTAQYTSNFTPSTSPPTDITNTQLLCNFTNAGIFDNTGKNNLETVADAQIDTTTKKFGTGSMEFDGTGDWLLMPNTPDQQLGTGNFTIEFWVYLATGDTGSARGLVAKGTSTTGLLVSLDSSQKVVFTFTTSTITSSGAITLDAWNHIAVVRSGTGSNQTKIYIAGTNDGTGTVSTDFNQTSVMYVGANRTGGDPMKGFIDDLRITKGVARYTANFTPPTAAFPDL